MNLENRNHVNILLELTVHAFLPLNNIRPLQEVRDRLGTALDARDIVEERDQEVNEELKKLEGKMHVGTETDGAIN